MTNPANESWAKLPGWGGAYLVELHSGRCKSVDRYVTNTLGQRNFLRGVELKPCGRSKIVTLSVRGARRSFTPTRLIEMAEA